MILRALTTLVMLTGAAFAHYALADVTIHDPVSMKHELQLNCKVMEKKTQMSQQSHHDTQIHHRPDASPRLELRAKHILDAAPSVSKAKLKQLSANDNKLYLDSTVTYSNSSPYEKVVFAYDSRGNEVQRTKYTYSYGNGYGEWVNSERTVRAYDSNGRMTLQAEYQWGLNYSTNIYDWRGNSHYEYQYDEYGNLTISIEFHYWDAYEWRWDSGTKNEVEYSADGHQTLGADYYWNGEKWIGSNKETWEHPDEYGSFIRIRYSWDYDNDDWTGYYRQEVVYDQFGHECVYDESYWSDGIWRSNYRREQTFAVCADGVMHVVKHTTCYGWDDVNQCPYPNDQQEYDWDAKGRQILYSTKYGYDTYRQIWTGGDKTTYAYDDSDNIINETSYYISQNEWQASTMKEYAYDDKGNITHYAQKAMGTDEWYTVTLTDYTYVYDAADNILRVDTSNLYGPTGSIYYTYDDQNRLLTSTTTYIDYNGEERNDSRSVYSYNDGQAEIILYDWGGDDWHPYQKEITGNSYLTKYVWSDDQNDWYGISSVGVIETPNEFGGVSTLYFEYYGWILEKKEWERKEERHAVFDGKGLILQSQSLRYYDDELNFGIWEDFTYDEKGNNTSRTHKEWDDYYKIWNLHYLEEETYADNGYVTYVYTWYTRFNEPNTEPYYREIKSYDSKGRLILNARYDRYYEEDKWYGSWKQEFAYDDMDNLILDASYNGWDNETDDFVGNYLYSYKYDANYRLVERINYYWWDYSSHDWSGRTRETTVYDDVENTVTFTKSDWNNSDKVYIPAERTVKKYNELGQLLHEYYYSWNYSEENWSLRNYSVLTYDDDYNILESIKYYEFWGEMRESERTIYYYSTREMAVDDSDFKAFLNVYADLRNRDKWQSQWTEPKTIQDVYDCRGVTIAEGKITAVDLSNFGLYGPIPTSVFLLPNVKSINLSNNHFTNDAWMTEGLNGVNLESITEINISGNDFTGNLSPFAAQFPNLKELNAADNHFDDIYPMISPNVKVLNIRNQRIDYLAEVSFAQPGKLFDAYPRILLYDHEAQNYRDGFNAYINEMNYSWSVRVEGSKDKLYFDWGYWSHVFNFESGHIFMVVDANNSIFNLSIVYDQGDTNCDGTVDVLDLQNILVYIFNQLENKDPFNFKAADFKEDNNINVQDLVCLINLLGAQEPDTSNKVQAPERPLAYMHDGVLIINSTEDVAAFDIVLHGAPSVLITDQLKAMGMSINVSKAGEYTHIIACSLDGATIPNGITAIANIGSADVADYTLANSEAKRITSVGDITSISSVENTSTIVKAVSDGFVINAQGREASWILYAVDGTTVSSGEINGADAQPVHIEVPSNHLYIIKVTTDNGNTHTCKSMTR